MTPETARKIVDAILEELQGRKGIGDELGMIENEDPENYEEIIASNTQVVLAVVSQEP